ncbi:MAG: hypothetical protein R3C19_03660 [Planctomycetaceae bacterium]
MRKIGPVIPALLLTALLSGCSTGFTLFERHDKYTTATPGSDQWWNEKAMLPPGVRQKCYKGKVWPVRPRPDCEPQQFTHTYHSATYWPLPYVCQDRQSVKDFIETQVAKGWQEETTLYSRHFNENDQMLTVPGRLHLQQIVGVTPNPRRTVFVQSTQNGNIDRLRVQNVELAIAELTGGMEVIPVALRNANEYSRPASEVKIINDLYNQSTPVPRLGSAAGGGNGGGVSVGP